MKNEVNTAIRNHKARLARQNLLACLCKAKRCLEDGDPTEAVEALDLALRLPMQDGDRRRITEAKDQADFGSTENAGHLLRCFVPGTGGKAPPKAKPFKFKPNKRTESDVTNGERAGYAGQMLCFLRDADNLSQNELLSDGLANLLHWADREKVDFDAALKTARMHHEMER